MEIERLKTALEKVEDPRRTDRGHVLHKLEDILIIGLCTLVCNGSDFSDMEDFGREREEWLRKFLELPNGIPDSDTFRRIFERLNPKMLAESLYDWLSNNRKEGSVIAVDGKTICGSGNHCTGTTYLRNAGKGGTGGGKCGKGPILGGFAAGRPRYKGGMSQLF